MSDRERIEALERELAESRAKLERQREYHEGTRVTDRQYEDRIDEVMRELAAARALLDQARDLIRDRAGKCIPCGRCWDCRAWNFLASQPPSVSGGAAPGLQFRKRPIVVEAFQMTEARRNDNADWPHWLNQAWNGEMGKPGSFWCDYPGRERLVIGTLEGAHVVTYGDWIIRGIKGELYPCKPDVFAATYEPVAAPTPAADPETAPAPGGRRTFLFQVAIEVAVGCDVTRGQAEAFLHERITGMTRGHSVASIMTVTEVGFHGVKETRTPAPVAPMVVREPQAGDVWLGPSGTEWEFDGTIDPTRWWNARMAGEDDFEPSWDDHSFTDGTLTFVRSAEPVSPSGTRDSSSLGDVRPGPASLMGQAPDPTEKNEDLERGTGAGTGSPEASAKTDGEREPGPRRESDSTAAGDSPSVLLWPIPGPAAPLSGTQKVREEGAASGSPPTMPRTSGAEGDTTRAAPLPPSDSPEPATPPTPEPEKRCHECGHARSQHAETMPPHCEECMCNCFDGVETSGGRLISSHPLVKAAPSPVKPPGDGSAWTSKHVAGLCTCGELIDLCPDQEKQLRDAAVSRARADALREVTRLIDTTEFEPGAFADFVAISRGDYNRLDGVIDRECCYDMRTIGDAFALDIIAAIDRLASAVPGTPSTSKETT